MTIQEVTATATASITTTSYTVATGMTITPGAGDYLAVFSCSMNGPVAAGNQIGDIALHVNGSIVQHTERSFKNESSLDGSWVHAMTHALVQPTAGQAVDLRWKASTTAQWDMNTRSLTLFPVSAADVQQVTATADATTPETTDTQLTGMTITPGAGDYLLLFTASGEGPGNSRLAYSVYVNGSQVAHTERFVEQETSIPDTPFPVAIACKVSPGAGQVVEIRWRLAVGSGTATTHERTLTLYKSSNVTEASASADNNATNTTAAQINSLTLTPGADDYLALFSGSTFYGTVSSTINTYYSFYVGGSQLSASEKRGDHENSMDNSNAPFMNSRKVSPTGGQAVAAYWRSSVTDTRTVHGRTLVVVKETVAAGGGGLTAASKIIRMRQAHHLRR